MDSFFKWLDSMDRHYNAAAFAVYAAATLGILAILAGWL